MIIRSQDKKSITTDLNINIYEDDNGNSFEMINKSLTSLGTYSTEEKAIKVLDMIQNAYCKMKVSDCLENGTLWEVAEVSEKEAKEIIKGNKEFYVFQMPQDSEV